MEMLKGDEKRLPHIIQYEIALPPAVEFILRVLRQAGHTAYLAGGAVRDALLGLRIKDYDIATDAAPDRIAALFERTIPVGKAFGVMTVIIDNLPHEVATFRSEKGYADGRRPDEVHFSDAPTDASRRDFTINAMFHDSRRGEIIDYTGGLEDIGRKALRCVGHPPTRFAEDHLRLLRAIRFAARLGFAIEPKTAAAIREMSYLVVNLSPERIARELSEMLTGGQAKIAFAMLHEMDLLQKILPEAAAMDGLEQPREFHPEGDVWVHTLLMLELLDEALRDHRIANNNKGKLEPKDALAAADAPSTVPANDGSDHLSGGDMEEGGEEGEEKGRGESKEEVCKKGVLETWENFDEQDIMALAWAALLHDVGKPVTYTFTDRIRFHEHDRMGAEIATLILRRLRRPEKLIAQVAELIGKHMHFAHLREMRPAKLRRWMQSPDFALHLELHRLDCLSSHRKHENWLYGLQAWRMEKTKPAPKEPLLTGRDFLAKGIKPGPEIGQWLRCAKDAELEGVFSDRTSAMQWMEARIGESEGK